MLMALSNKFGALVLATGNKSGRADVDCTLYGNIPIARRFRPSQ
jgi:NH3-dependent NAD+ synthetase